MVKRIETIDKGEREGEMKYYMCDLCGDGHCTLSMTNKPRYEIKCVDGRIRHYWTEITFEEFMMLANLNSGEPVMGLNGIRERQ